MFLWGMSIFYFLNMFWLENSLYGENLIISFFKEENFKEVNRN